MSTNNLDRLKKSQTGKFLFNSDCYLFGSGIYKTLSGDGTPDDYDFACPNVLETVTQISSNNNCSIEQFIRKPDGKQQFRITCPDVDKSIDISDKGHITKNIAQMPSVMQVVLDKDGYKHIHNNGTICSEGSVTNNLVDDIKNRTTDNKNFENPKHQKYFAGWKLSGSTESPFIYKYSTPGY